MADLILVNAPSRTLRELYGEPPGGLSPTCTPKRGEQTVEDWYAEQEERYGLYAELKAKRPKTLWQRVTSREEPEPVEPAQQEQEQEQERRQPARRQPARQQPELSVQQKLRQQRQSTDKGSATPSETENGIFWFAFNREKREKQDA